MNKSSSSVMTQAQGELLAQLVHTMRPDWGTAGIAKALFEARTQGSPAAVAIAAIKAADDENNRTPAVIGMTGAHWQGLHHKPRRVVAGELCGICGSPRLKCETVWRNEHEFEDRPTALARAEAARLARQALAADQIARARTWLRVDPDPEADQ